MAAYHLRVTRRLLPLTEFLNTVDDLARSGRHVAFSWLPWSDSVAMQTMSLTDLRAAPTGRLQRWITTADEMRAGTIGWVATRRPGIVPRLSGLPSVLRHSADVVVRSPDAFCFAQPVRFVALEHALPIEATVEAVQVIGAALKAAGHWSPYSVLVRVGAADDAYLSPAYGRETAYMNLTVPRSAAYGELYRLIERPLRALLGRPHWGKAHTAGAAYLRPLYPMWDAFAQVRAKLDPHSTMSSEYMRWLLEE